MKIVSTPPATCVDCGCAAEECECWERPAARPEEVILRANRILALLKQSEEKAKEKKAKKKAPRVLELGNWVRITSGALLGAEGRIGSMNSRHVRLVQLNGTVLTVPRAVVEEAQFGTDWVSLYEAGR